MARLSSWSSTTRMRLLMSHLYVALDVALFSLAARITGRSAARLRFHPGAPAVQLHDALGDGEAGAPAHPSAWCLASWTSRNSWQIRACSAAGMPGCCRRRPKRKHSIDTRGGNAHLAIIRELDGVTHQIAQRLGGARRQAKGQGLARLGCSPRPPRAAAALPMPGI